jgi:threonine/homoserine/homoserine lactone efflux protein
MAGTDVLIAFALATAVFAYFPGPALLYTIAQTLARGRRGGLMAALGIHLGGYAHVLAATLGLSALFQHVPELFLVVKIAGALYLVWLGIGMLRSGDDFAALPGAGPGVSDKSVPRALVDSFIVELLNPKVALFFIAFLPQFVDPAGSLPVWTQFLILGVIVNVAFSSADLIAVLFTSALAGRLKRSGRALRVARRVGGALLIGLGARLALDRS